MQYIAKFSNYEGLKLPDGNLLKGNIAHKLIENLFTIQINRGDNELNISNADFNSEFDKVVKQEGAVFLQNENLFDLSEFRYRFQKSLETLIKIINTNNLKIISCEQSFGKDTACIIDEALGRITGSIDLLLEDQNGQPIIFDLKWTVSEKKYKEKIEKGEAVQLALYTAALNNRDLCSTGYFMLNQNKLLTAANLDGNRVEKIPGQYANQDVLNKIKNSLEYRWKEFKDKKLEMGELLELIELDYYKQEDVISIPEGDKKTKKENPYTGFNLFKGTLN